MFRTRVINVIGPGVALDIEALIRELASLKERNVPDPQLKVSDRAQVLMDFHVMLDTYEVERLADRKFGSTKSGIAPFYSDKFAKVGIQVCQLFDKDLLHARLVNSLTKKNILLKHLYNKPELDADELTEKYYALGQQIKPLVCNTTNLLHDALKADKSILLEGQLGALRDCHQRNQSRNQGLFQQRRYGFLCQQAGRRSGRGTAQARRRCRRIRR